MRTVILSMLMLGAMASARTDAQRPAGYPRSYDGLVANARGERMVRIYGNADTAAMQPLIAAFRRAYPGVQVRYDDLESSTIYDRVVAQARSRTAGADLVWSSAMDLQAKLINDGYAQSYLSPEKPALPDTAVWKNMGYGVTAEPVAFVVNRRLIPAAQVPRTHEAFEQLLRTRRAELMGEVATYDPAQSNVGYLYLTEDHAITRDTRSLVQAIAATRPILSRTIEPMLDAVSAGRIAIAYNVVGPYLHRHPVGHRHGRGDEQGGRRLHSASAGAVHGADHRDAQPAVHLLHLQRRLLFRHAADPGRGGDALRRVAHGDRPRLADGTAGPPAQPAGALDLSAGQPGGH
ncbi:ABC transporter substrate-binding protein [Sphingomonas sp. 2378]